MACKFLEDFNGNKSSKRLAGAFCLVFGPLMKFSLFLYGLRHVTATPFDKLDSSAESLIYVGAALIGSGLLELLRQSKK